MIKPDAAPNNTRGRLFILLIAVMTFGPFFLAWYLAQHPELLGKTSNYGELIVPPKPMDLSQLPADPASAPRDMNELKGHWVLLQVAPQGQCNTACLDGLHLGKQVWLRLSKDIPRLRRLLVATGALEPATAAAVRRGDDTLLVAQANAAAQSLLESLALPAGPGATLWLIDPQGNVMMRYPLNYEPHGLLRDLQQLLKISQTG